MDQFNNRISTQRKILKLINRTGFKEDITSLSKISIEKWLLKNNLEKDSKLAVLVLDISSKLQFLANKSQEQIAESYTELSNGVDSLYFELEGTLLGCKIK